MSTTKLVQLTCRFCGHTWKPRVENPLKCPNCGQIVIRPFECSHGVCKNHNAPTIIQLEPVVIVCKDYYLRLITLANQTGASLEKLVDALLNTSYEELYSKGLLNLAKEG